MLRIVPSQAERLLIEILEARGPGKFYSPRTTKLKVWAIVALSRVLFAESMFLDVFSISGSPRQLGGKLVRFSEKRSLRACSAILAALPGANAPGKVRSPSTAESLI